LEIKEMVVGHVTLTFQWELIGSGVTP